MAGPAVMKVEITRDDALSKSIHCSTVESERTAASELGSRAFSRVAHARAIRESTHSPISTETRPTSHHDGQLPKWQRDEHFTSSPRSSQPYGRNPKRPADAARSSSSGKLSAEWRRSAPSLPRKALSRSVGNIKRGGERARAAPGVSHCCGAFSVGTGGYTPPAIYPIESRFAFLTVSICRLRMQ